MIAMHRMALPFITSRHITSRSCPESNRVAWRRRAVAEPRGRGRRLRLGRGRRPVLADVVPPRGGRRVSRTPGSPRRAWSARGADRVARRFERPVFV